jgi:hypothetical protein
MALCASCKQKVEDGAVRCVNCGAQLDLPGAFVQVIGWVLVAVSTIPFAISEVTTAERNLAPLLLGVGVLVVGIVLVVTGRLHGKAAAATTIPEPPIQRPTGA